MRKPVFSWPEGKKLAVLVQVMLETFSEGKTAAYSVQTTQLKPGSIDHSGITWVDYGGRVGVWRLMRLLESYGIPGTFAVSAKCSELYPEALVRLVKGGHEIIGHGPTQDTLLAYMNPDEERQAIRQSFDALEKTTGTRPAGWISPVLAWTPNTAGFLAEAGALWYGDLNYVDIPIVLKTGHGPLVGIPISEFTDNRLLKSSPRHILDVHRDTFDYLNRKEPMGFLSMLFHCHTGGRAPMVAALDQLLAFMTRYPDVWFATGSQIAHWIKAQGYDEVTYAQRYFAE